MPGAVRPGTVGTVVEFTHRPGDAAFGGEDSGVRHRVGRCRRMASSRANALPVPTAALESGDPLATEVRPLSTAAEKLALVDDGHATGKVVLIF